MALASQIADVLYHQAYEVRDDYWEQDISALVERLVEFGCKRTTASVRYPNPRAFPKALSSEALGSAIRRLNGWDLATSVVPGREPKTGTELVKSFQFPTFKEALAFMNSAAPYIYIQREPPSALGKRLFLCCGVPNLMGYRVPPITTRY